MKRWSAAILLGALVGGAFTFIVVYRMVNSGEPYAGENAMGYVWVPVACVVGAAIAVTATAVVTAVKSK